MTLSRFVGVVAFVVMSFAILFCTLTGQGADAQGGQSAGAANNEAVARAFMTDLAGHNFDAAEARFSPQVAGMLPKEKLAQAWEQITSQFGAFDSVQGVRPGTNPAVVTLICKFSHGMLDAILPFNDAQQLIGFRLVPAAEVGAPGPAWVAPDYARADSFTERDVTVGNAPWALPGTLTVPKGAGPFAAVVLVHGSGPEDRDEAFGPNKMFKDLAWGLATRGVAVLRYEKRTKLYGAQMMAGPVPMTVKQETEDDAVAAVALLAGTPGIDAKHIYLAGHSLGGYLAPRIAAGDAQIAGLILLAGTTRPLEDDVVDQVTDQLTKAGQQNSPEGQQMIAKAKADAAAIKDPNLKPGAMLTFAGVKIPSEYFLDLRSYDPVKAAQGLKIPMLILQGERDYQVTMVDFANWKNGLAGRGNVTLKSYPALNHFFMAGTGPATPAEYNVAGHVEADVVEDVGSWIRGKEK